MNKFAILLTLSAATALATGAYKLSTPQQEQEITPLQGSTSSDYMYNQLRKAFPSLQSDQFSNARSILDYAVTKTVDKKQLAYILATAIHESNLRPIKEYRAREGTSLWYTQNRYWYTGYYGRGYVQLTWQSNYQKFKNVLGVDLVGNPDLALNPTYAARILAVGMKNGMFTGVGLDNYLGPNKNDWYNARRIVNGLDKASTFAATAQKIYSA